MIKFIFIFEFLKYFLIILSFYILFYKILYEKLLHRKIQTIKTKNKFIFFDLKYSIINLFIFSLMGIGDYWLYLNGYTKMYLNLSDFGMTYYILSIIIMLILHDTYFYWTHRFMHLKNIYPHVHKVHHHSTNPTPFTSYSFHPIEGIINNFIATIMILILPMHVSAIFLYRIISMILNVIGHLGYEIFNSGFTKHWFKGLSSTSTNHNMHHRYFNCNYGLFFNIWDRIMKTNHKDYHNTFEKIVTKD